MSLWPNWIRRLTTNQKIGGSSPSRDNFFTILAILCVFVYIPRTGTFADIAQLGERQTEDLKVPGSIPGVGNLFWISFCNANKLSAPGRRTMASWPSG